jgi:hypothetical protein
MAMEPAISIHARVTVSTAGALSGTNLPQNHLIAALVRKNGARIIEYMHSFLQVFALQVRFF